MATKFLPKFGVFSLIFSFQEISAFYEEFLPKSLHFLHPYISFDFLTFLNNLEIQDGGSKMADIFKV